MEVRKIVVPGWLDFSDYEISEFGDVWSCKDGERRPLLGTVSKRHGRLQVGLSQRGVKKTFGVYRLVAFVFIGPPPDSERTQVQHKDGSGHLGRGSNNHYSNLKWGSPKENSADAKVHGTQVFGEKQGRSVLTEYQATEVKRRLVDGESAASIARELGVSAYPVYHILYDRVWRHIPWPCSAERLAELQSRRKPKLNKDKASEIRRRVLLGERQIDLAREFGVSKATVGDIVRRGAWSK